MKSWHVSGGTWIAALGCVIFGAIDEAGQLWVPGRTAELRDVMIDAAGAFVGIAVTLAWLAWSRRRRRRAFDARAMDENGRG